MVRRRDLIKAAAITPALVAPTLRSERVAAYTGDGTTITPVSPDEQARLDQAILPRYRILSYYGFPGNEFMGILGELEPDALLERLRQQAAAYEALDPSRPWKLAFEVIASVAQRDPQADNSYLAYASAEMIQRYVDYTAQNDILLILDVQYGRKTTQDEVQAMLPWLEYPHVHLALDPEFSVEDGEVPGEVLGKIPSSAVTWAQNFLADFARERNLPPKILVVHQFNWYSITDRRLIQPVPGVQFVLEVDGWGPPGLKLETYRVLAGDDSLQYYGFKLWYKQDEPLMTEAEVLSLNPSPDIVIYQ